MLDLGKFQITYKISKQGNVERYTSYYLFFQYND